MINTEHAYFESGFKAGQAVRRGDAALSDFHRRWFRDARALEKPEDRAYVDKLWGQGYLEAQPTRKPEYFR